MGKIVEKAHIMKLRVELLIKEELTYELLGRGVVTFTEESTVEDLRKLLRTHQAVEFNPSHLEKSLIVEDELVLVEEKLCSLDSYVRELSSKSVSKILRAETTLRHVELRCNTILYLRTTEDNKKKCLEFLEKALALKTVIEQVGVDEQTKEQVFRKLSESMAEEESLNDVFTQFDNQPPVSMSVPSGSTSREVTVSSLPKLSAPTSTTYVNNMQPIMSSQNLPTFSPILSAVQNAPSVNNVHGTVNPNSLCQYSKLQNPVDKYLKMFKPTNGLNANELLNFIKVCLKMSAELKLNSSLILELSSGYTYGPLLHKILELKTLNAKIEQVHVELFRCFIPINLRENLRRSMVNRPQKLGEPLSLYCSELKENAKILLCPYSEGELVEIIKLGISPQDRSRLVFMGNPTTFTDLDNLCIQVQNMAYSDHLRSNMSSKSSHMVHNVNSQGSEVREMNRPIICYKCQKPGHIARHCYSNNRSSGMSKNSK